MIISESSKLIKLEVSSRYKKKDNQKIDFPLECCHPLHCYTNFVLVLPWEDFMRIMTIFLFPFLCLVISLSSFLIGRLVIYFSLEIEIKYLKYSFNFIL